MAASAVRPPTGAAVVTTEPVAAQERHTLRFSATEKPRVRWGEGTVDNEGLGRKKSKCKRRVKWRGFLLPQHPLFSLPVHIPCLQAVAFIKNRVHLVKAPRMTTATATATVTVTVTMTVTPARMVLTPARDQGGGMAGAVITNVTATTLRVEKGRKGQVWRKEGRGERVLQEWEMGEVEMGVLILEERRSLVWGIMTRKSDAYVFMP
jgi:hypothetical protein